MKDNAHMTKRSLRKHFLGGLGVKWNDGEKVSFANLKLDVPS